MKSDEKLWEICMNIYEEMYNRADPSADIHEIMRSGEGKQSNFFRKYYLPMEEHNEIMERHIKINKLTKREAEKIRFTVTLGSGPSSVRKDWDTDENTCTSERCINKECHCT
jgi:hypothetical protein